MLTTEQLKNKVETDIKKYRKWKIIKPIVLTITAALFAFSAIDCFRCLYGHWGSICNQLWFLSIPAVIQHVLEVRLISHCITDVAFWGFLLDSALFVPTFFIIKSKSGLPTKPSSKHPTIDEARHIFLKHEQAEMVRQQEFVEEYEREINSLK